MPDIELAHIGFKKLAGQLAAKGATNPAGLAAYIGKKKYGAAAFAKLSKKGKVDGKKTRKVQKIAASETVRLGRIVEFSNESGVVMGMYGDSIAVHTAAGMREIPMSKCREIEL